MAFWITAVLALLYGLIGQFSVATLLLRVEETAVGAVLGMLAGFLVLPAGTRAAFGNALDAVVDAAHAVLDAAVDRMLGRPVAVAPVDLARDMDAALGVLRQRARPLDNPLPRRRGRSSYARAVRVFTSRRPLRPAARPALRHRTRARLGRDPHPAVERIRTNIDGLRALLMHTDGPERGLRGTRGGRGRGARRPRPRYRAAQAAAGGRPAAAPDGPGRVGFAIDLGAPQTRGTPAEPGARVRLSGQTWTPTGGRGRTPAAR